MADGIPGGWPAGGRPWGWIPEGTALGHISGPYQQREVHNHTCVLMPGTCLEQGMPTRRLPILVPLTHTRSALDTEPHGHTPCTLTEDTHPATLKTRLGAPHKLT